MMSFVEWVHQHFVAALMPDMTFRTDDDLYDWVAREQAALRARIQAERDIIQRRDQGPASQDRPEDAR